MTGTPFAKHNPEFMARIRAAGGAPSAAAGPTPGPGGGNAPPAPGGPGARPLEGEIDEEEQRRRRGARRTGTILSDSERLG